MKVIKLGGPCYRIGVGGGAASSTIQVVILGGGDPFFLSYLLPFL